MLLLLEWWTIVMKAPSNIIEVFEHWPVNKSVNNLAIPAIISQLVTATHSLVDTYFIGQTGNDKQIAAVSVSFTAMLVLNTIANLFGIGGSSLLSRSLGAKQYERATHVSTFSLYGAILLSLLYSFIMAIFPEPIAYTFGSTEGFILETCNYLRYTVVFGAVPAVMTMVLGHLIRAEGASKKASFGLCLSAIMKIILDPVFVYPWGLNMGVSGVALATALSNCFSLSYFITYIHRHKGSSKLSLSPKQLTTERDLVVEVLSVGFPQSIKTSMSIFSNSIINHLAISYGEHVVASIGIIRKFELLPMNIATGFSAGSLPLIGYSYASGAYNRMKQALIYTQRFVLTISLTFLFIYMVFANQLVTFFIRDDNTANISAQFLRVAALALPGMSVSFIFTGLFQATGRTKEALFLSLYRKGAVDIPLLFILEALFSVWGLMIVQPIVDTTAMILSFSIENLFFN